MPGKSDEHEGRGIAAIMHTSLHTSETPKPDAVVWRNSCKILHIKPRSGAVWRILHTWSALHAVGRGFESLIAHQFRPIGAVDQQLGDGFQPLPIVVLEAPQHG